LGKRRVEFFNRKTVAPAFPWFEGRNRVAVENPLASVLTADGHSVLSFFGNSYGSNWLQIKNRKSQA
jgi:hypothetical protein